MLQTSIDDKTNVLRRLISSTPILIRNEFEAIKTEAQSTAEENGDGDSEVYRTILTSIYYSSRLEEEEWMVAEFYRSMALIICSFAESTLKSMIDSPLRKRNWGQRALDDYFEQIKSKYNLTEFPDVQELWPGYDYFLDKRNDITHGYKDDKGYHDYQIVMIDQGDLLIALDGIHRLLRSIADAIDIVQNGMREFVDYLWTP